MSFYKKHIIIHDLLFLSYFLSYICECSFLFTCKHLPQSLSSLPSLQWDRLSHTKSLGIQWPSPQLNSCSPQSRGGQLCSSAPSGQSRCPSHFWPCEIQVRSEHSNSSDLHLGAVIKKSVKNWGFNLEDNRYMASQLEPILQLPNNF